MLSLNLGGGHLPVEGFLNVDLCEGADITHDLREPLPFRDGEIEEIIATHVIESFYAWQFPAILSDWHRVLRKGGTITIEFTSLKDTVKMYLDGDIHGRWGLYGNQDTEIDPILLHHYVYEKEEMKDLLEKAGFKNIEFTQEGIMHMPVRDWRVICQA